MLMDTFPAPLCRAEQEIKYSFDTISRSSRTMSKGGGGGGIPWDADQPEDSCLSFRDEKPKLQLRQIRSSSSGGAGKKAAPRRSAKQAKG